MTTPIDTRRDLLTVIARMHAKRGKEQELREALEAAHLNAPHLVEFAGRLDDLLDESGLVIERVQRVA
jgi:hypothetical protein